MGNKDTDKVKTTNMLLSRRKLLVLSFLEGAMVISVEMFGAKMLVPLYGNSLIVWTSVLGITIAFLALGYLAGSRLTVTKQPQKKLSLIISIASLLILFMPVFAGILSGGLAGITIYAASVLSAMLLLGPPLFVLALISPVIIQQLATLNNFKLQVNRPGESAGLVYAVSTCGGVLFNFIIGFWVLPQFGITVPVIITAFLAIAFSFYIYFERKSLLYLGAFIILSAKLISGLNAGDAPGSSTRYLSEGLLGQLKVEDIKDARTGILYRYLFVNGIPQSVIVNSDGPMKGTSGWPYIHKMAVIATLKPQSSDALLIGIAGGSIAGELTRLKIKADLLDHDKRMYDVAKKYFFLSAQPTSFICDDARHYIAGCKKTYDLIIMDVFNAEVQPAYLFTRESFAEIKKILRPGGILVLQFGEQAKHEGVSAYRSVCNTLLDGGFKVYADFLEAENVTDALIVASVGKVDFSIFNHESVNPCCAAQPWFKGFIKNPADEIDEPFENGIVLTDDKPLLEMLNSGTIRIWREWATKTYALPEIENNKPLFR